MIIKQIQLTHYNVFSYLIGCEETRDAAIIDPGSEPEKLKKEADSADFNIKYILNTHHHADHTGGNGVLKKMTGAKILIHELEIQSLMRLINFSKIGTFNYGISPEPDIIIKEDTSLIIGKINLKIIHTPGHTPGGICFYSNENLFTGDTLFVGDSGRTDLPGGNRSTLGSSLRRIMKEFPENTVVWSGHNYGPTLSSTLAWEKQNNKNAKEYGYYTGK